VCVCSVAFRACCCFIQDKVMKFANYFLSRKHTHLLKDVTSLLQVLSTMSTSAVGGALLLLLNGRQLMKISGTRLRMNCN